MPRRFVEPATPGRVRRGDDRPGRSTPTSDTPTSAVGLLGRFGRRASRPARHRVRRRVRASACLATTSVCVHRRIGADAGDALGRRVVQSGRPAAGCASTSGCPGAGRRGSVGARPARPADPGRPAPPRRDRPAVAGRFVVARASSGGGAVPSAERRRRRLVDGDRAVPGAWCGVDLVVVRCRVPSHPASLPNRGHHAATTRRIPSRLPRSRRSIEGSPRARTSAPLGDAGVDRRRRRPDADGLRRTVGGSGHGRERADANLTSSAATEQLVRPGGQELAQRHRDFWKANYPKISGGKPLPPLKGGLYSVDGVGRSPSTGGVSGPASKEACIERSPGFIIDNGAFCVLDDSIVWDRADPHLFAQLAKKYGPLMVGADLRARVRARDQLPARRLRPGTAPKTIDTESQADCAAGAWAAWALQAAGRALPRRHAADAGRRARGLPRRPRLDARHARRASRTATASTGSPRSPTASTRASPTATRTATSTARSPSGRSRDAGGLRRRRQHAARRRPRPRRTTSSSRTSTGSGRARPSRSSKTFTPVKIAAGRSRRSAASPPTLRVRLLPRRQHRLLQRGVRQMRAYNSLPGVDDRPGHRQRHAAVQPAGRLRARRAVRDRLGPGRAAPALQPAT